MDAKVIKKSTSAEGGTNKSATGKCDDGKGGQKDCPIDNDHIIKGQPLYKNFKLNVTTAVSKPAKGPNGNFDGVTPLSKINGTAMTIADVLKKDEKLLIGSATYTKKCDSLGHCFVAKCKHYGQASNRQRYCTIYKDLMPKDIKKDQEADAAAAAKKKAAPAKPAAPAAPAAKPAAAPAAQPAQQQYYSRPATTAYPTAASYATTYAPRPVMPTASSWYSPMSAKWMSAASTVLLATLFTITQ